MQKYVSLISHSVQQKIQSKGTESKEYKAACKHKQLQKSELSETKTKQANKYMINNKHIRIGK